MQGDMMEAAQVVLEVQFEGISLDHSAAQEGIRELIADLRSAVREEEVADGGSKGAPVELVVSLGASGTVAGLVRIVKLWLTRDRRRTMTVSVRDMTKETVISIEGDQISVDALNQALNSIVNLNQHT
jgi:hypothetical protein